MPSLRASGGRWRGRRESTSVQGAQPRPLSPACLALLCHSPAHSRCPAPAPGWPASCRLSADAFPSWLDMKEPWERGHCLSDLEVGLAGSPGRAHRSVPASLAVVPAGPLCVSRFPQGLPRPPVSPAAAVTHPSGSRGEVGGGYGRGRPHPQTGERTGVGSCALTGLRAASLNTGA